MASAAHPPHHLTDPTRVTLSSPRSLNAHSPPPRRRIFSAPSLMHFPSIYIAVIFVAGNRRRAGARQGGQQPRRRAGGRSRGAAPLRRGRPLEHQHALARAHGVSMPRKEENKWGGGAPSGGSHAEKRGHHSPRNHQHLRHLQVIQLWLRQQRGRHDGHDGTAAGRAADGRWRAPDGGGGRREAPAAHTGRLSTTTGR